jgi:isoamylase
MPISGSSVDAHMLAFTKGLIRLRREHPVFPAASVPTGVATKELRWYTPAGAGADWANSGAHSLAVYLDGADDPDRAGLRLAATPTPAWHPEADTYERSGLAAAASLTAGDDVTVRPRSVVLLRRTRS